jgi:hypothetical protein
MTESHQTAYKRPIYRDAIFWCLAFVTLLAHIRYLFTQSANYNSFWVYLDEGYRLYTSLRMLRGETLFSDFFTAYPPFSFYFHTLAYAIFGVKVSSVRIVLICSQVSTTLLTYVVSRYLMNRWFSLLAAFFTIAFGIVYLNMGYSGWYVIPCMLSMTLFLFRWITSNCTSRFALFNAGLFAGLATSIKLRDGAWMIIGCLVAILAIHVLKNFSPGRGRPKPFNLLYISHLLLPMIVFLMLLGKDLEGVFFGRTLLFLLPNILICAALLIRQLFFTLAIRPFTRDLIKECLIFVSGIAVIIMPWVLYYLFSIGPEILWKNLIIIPMELKTKLIAWELIRLPMKWAVCGSLATAVLIIFSVVGPLRWRVRFVLVLTLWIFSITIAFWISPSTWMEELWKAGPNTLDFFSQDKAIWTWTDSLWRAGLFIMLPFASGLSVLFFAVHRQQTDFRVLAILTLGIMNGVVLMTLHPFTDFYHWLWACPLSFIIFSFCASRFYAILHNHGLHFYKWVVALTACALLLYSMLPAFAGIRGNMPIKRLINCPRGDIPMNYDSADQVQRIIDFVNQNVPEDGCILEIPGSLFAFLANRQQASHLDYFFSIDGTLWDEESEILAIERNNPHFAFLWTEKSYLPYFSRAFPKITNWLNKNYVPYSRIGPILVLIKRNGPRNTF